MVTLSDTCLSTTRHAIQLQVEGFFTLDVDMFDADTPPDDLTRLAQGEFLSGFLLQDADTFNDWVLLQQMQWHNIALDRIALWTEAALDDNQPKLALQLTQRQLALEPWRETAHQQAMRAYAQQENWTAVQKQYQQCVSVLQAELGVMPNATTQKLAEQPHQTPPPHNLKPILAPIIGREAALTQMNALIAERQYRLFTLLGIGGTGKTQLASLVAHSQLENFRHGVWFVPLAGADKAEQILGIVAETIGSF